MQYIWSTHYKIKNIKMLVSTALLSALAANLFAPLIILFVLYKSFSFLEMSLWMGVHILFLILRIAVRNRIIIYLNSYNTVNNKYTNILLFLTSFTGVLYAYIIWKSVLIGISSETLFLISSVILVLTAGSISTLMSVFQFFTIFVLITMLSSISAVFYYGSYIFEVYGVLLLIFTAIFLKAGYQQYSLIDNLLSLKNAFEAIYENSSDGIVLIKGHKYKDCNSAFMKMFLFDSKEEFFATNVADIMPKYQENGKLSMREMLRIANETIQKSHTTCEWIYKKRDGTIFWTEIVFTKIYIDDEELVHAIVRDITVKKELEQQREKFYTELEYKVNEEVEKNRQKDKAMLQQSKLAQMGEMISMIAHQWRQPLSAISATSGSLSLKAQIGTLDKETTLEFSNKITEFAQHLSRTIDDFRNFFKPDKQKENVNLSEPITRALQIVKMSMNSKGINITSDFKTQETIMLYQNEIMQVILNILKNSEDNFLEKNILNPTIKIVTYKENNNHIISICDNGGGISKDILSKIFNPYFSTKDEKNGTGLGLYMSKIMVEDHHNGNLSATNSTNGVCFKIKLQKE